MTSSPAPLSLRIVIGIVAVETIAVWVTVIALGVAVARDEGTGALRTLGYVALYALSYPWLLRGLVRRRRWAVAPLIVLQLLLVALGLTLAAGQALIGLPIAALAAGCVVALLVPTSREALS